MDFVMINQLPELAIPRNRIIGQKNNMIIPKEKRNPYLSKWHALFDNSNEQWISFQPRIGRVAYPCFACRDMFANRSSFLDHVNRRGMILKYFCPHCEQYMTFHNVCSFLIHARSHFADSGGSIDLENVDISTIPMDVAGFLPHPDYPRIFEDEEISTRYGSNINVKFYKPKEECLGTRVVFFEPNELIFYSTVRSNNTEEVQSMRLCQVCENIPKCEFINVLRPSNKRNIVPAPAVTINNNIIKNGVTDVNKNITESAEVHSDDDVIPIHTVPDEIICLDDDSSDEELVNNFQTTEGQLKLKNIKNLQNSNSSSSDDENRVKSPNQAIKLENQVPRCQECGQEQTSPMKDHFQQNNKPINDNITCMKCSLILPTMCALRAHSRIHNKKSPYVCPECGKDFDIWHKLFSHMEDVCFHLAKHIRYKCPAKKCGKIFAQTLTFNTHIPLQHVAIRFTCDICADTFSTEKEFLEHAKIHTVTAALPVTSYECLICAQQFDNSVEEHIQIHVHDCDNRIYIYTCKYCKSYYRSKNTYAAHLLRCSKLLLNTQVKKEAGIDKNQVQCKVVRYCRKCDCKIQFHCTYKDVKSIGKSCPQCNTNFTNMVTEEVRSQFLNKNTIIVQNGTNRNICLLCNKQINSNGNHKCKYQNPIVILNKKNTLDSSPDVSPDTSSSEDSIRPKRKRFFSPSKNKKPHLDEEELIPIKPIVFNGEYNCNVCDYKTESRQSFHQHIQQHRDVSTVYQCMECGECFVVKPSLIKHLQVFHLIENVESYMKENECFDKEAVRELQENMRMIPGETKEPVAENQCRVCRQMFSDQQELSKHFRVHGMAFLMKKIIKE